MATSERMIVDPNGLQFNAGSMDRFGDDLCELIVGYLPFVDKTRLECVASQWRRVMPYNSVKTLRIGSRFELIGKISETVFVMRSAARQEDYKHLEQLFGKCENIKKIVFNNSGIINRALIALIAKYCKSLDSLEINGTILMSRETITLFGSSSSSSNSVGPKVKRLAINSRGLHQLTAEAEKQLLANCPNVETLECSTLSAMSGIRSRDAFLPKLKSLSMYYFEANNVSQFTNFVDKYQEQLKSLTIQTTSCFNPISMTTHFKDIVLNDISRLEGINYLKLQVLSVHDPSGEDQPLVNIDDQLRQIGRMCRQLKRFSLGVVPQIKIECNVWRNFSEYNALESFELNLNTKTTGDQSMASMGLKKNLKKITILMLESEKEITFANIHQIVPNLKSFTFRTTSEVTDKLLLGSLSQLNHLKEVFIQPMGKEPKITEDGVNRLLANCPQLTRFVVQNWIDIGVGKRQKLFVKLLPW